MKLWHWLMAPDPTPGLTAKKMGRLLLKAFLFALVVVLLQSLLYAAGLKFVNTWWGSALVVLLLYVPFARFLAVDMMPAPRPRAAATSAKKASRVDARKFAGVKKGPPRQRR